jgi:hypothetical protein
MAFSILLSHFINDLAGQHEQRYSHRALRKPLQMPWLTTYALANPYIFRIGGFREATRP